MQEGFFFVFFSSTKPSTRPFGKWGGGAFDGQAELARQKQRENYSTSSQNNLLQQRQPVECFFLFVVVVFLFVS